ncbi:mitogen-activated protein kinase kinase kinase 18-like [Neltuma alba]|uniref:mitogen-activated protein kinase kinase kinase 18-like n=1 Tax=Neltuma alba TaxID=207710 RepID=UPI0010A3E1A0|nr:mitogen-activated protein kinase kinase kinase 18-like [Prosopis alba]
MCIYTPCLPVGPSRKHSTHQFEYAKLSSVSAMTSWVRGNCIGKGAFGTVSVGIDRWDGRVFAVKSVDLNMALSAQAKALENEIRILRRVSPSPYVVEFLGDDFTTSCRNLHMEYMPGGTLADLASRNADVDEELVRYYTWCLVNALRNVHSKGVVHCDVKGRNVLLGPKGCVAKLADFGSAVEFSGEVCSSAVLPRGSPLWMAPEVIRREYQGPESDVWSLGCTVIEMVNGKPGWEDHGGDTLSRIGYSDDLPELPGQLSELGRDFLKKCLRREPKQRWSCDQLLQHPFLSSASPNKPVESSPRCILDWNNLEFTEEDEEEEIIFDHNAEASAKERIRKLATTVRADWETEDWVAVRGSTSDAEYTAVETGDGGSGGGDEEGTNSEYRHGTGAEEEMKVGTSREYLDDVGRANPGKWESDGKWWLLGWRCDHREGKERSNLAGRSCPHEYISENVDLHLVLTDKSNDKHCSQLALCTTQIVLLQFLTLNKFNSVIFSTYLSSTRFFFLEHVPRKCG